MPNAPTCCFSKLVWREVPLFETFGIERIWGATLNDIASDIDRYLAEQSNLDLLRFITCGSVDDGKSTLIGRNVVNMNPF